jgi:hypothetical protein
VQTFACGFGLAGQFTGLECRACSYLRIDRPPLKMCTIFAGIGSLRGVFLRKYPALSGQPRNKAVDLFYHPL